MFSTRYIDIFDKNCYWWKYASMSRDDRKIARYFSISSSLEWAKKNRFKGLSSQRAAQTRLMNRERIFNFNSAINSWLTHFPCRCWKAALNYLKPVVRDENFDFQLLFHLIWKTLSENYLRRLELISLAVEWATMCMWNIFFFLFLSFDYLIWVSKGGRRIFYDTREDEKSV